MQAYQDCRRHKRNTHSALAFEIDAERNLRELYQELAQGTYRPGPSTCFVVTRPRPREVWAASFRDRIAHHLLYNAVGGTIEARFIADCCACIKGRGTLYAATRLEHKVRSITRNWSRDAHYLKLDLANFFVAIDKQVLAEQLRWHIGPGYWRDLAILILEHDPRAGAIVQGSAERLALVPAHKSLWNQPAHLGLPIGNLSSQFFANIYLNDLDQYVKHELRARHYIRYVDDLVLLHESPQWLLAAQDEIERFLGSRLHASINPSKTILQPIGRGVDFVGQVIKPWRRITRRRTISSAHARLNAASPVDRPAMATSYFGLLGQASHSHSDRAELARHVLTLGHSVALGFRKAHRRRDVT